MSTPKPLKEDPKPQELAVKDVRLDTASEQTYLLPLQMTFQKSQNIKNTKENSTNKKEDQNKEQETNNDEQI